MVRDISVADGIVSLTIVLTIAGCPLRQSFEDQVERALADVPGVRGASLSFGVMTPEERQALTAKLRGGAPADESVIRLGRNTRVISESLPSRKVDAFTLGWSVQVPANGSTTLTSVVETGW